MLKLLGLEEGIVSNDGTIKDNNSLFFNPVPLEPIYPEHYYWSIFIIFINNLSFIFWQIFYRFLFHKNEWNLLWEEFLFILPAAFWKDDWYKLKRNSDELILNNS